MTSDVLHGGPDNGPPITWDFSSNANAVAMPAALQATLLTADRSRYPDPHYTALRERLAEASGVPPELIVPTAGSSEGIRRLTLAAYLQGVRQVWVPQPGYADYQAAALALGMAVHPYASPTELDHALSGQTGVGQGVLLWLCEPCNPTGASLPASFWRERAVSWRKQAQVIVAVDRAYEPLRLSGCNPISAELGSWVWQFHSPNKALGLTGVRAGWIQAPSQDPWRLREAMSRLAPSWVLSAEGVALLMHWHDEATCAWLHQSRQTLARWMASQQARLSERGWLVEPTDVPFYLTRPPGLAMRDLDHLLWHLRQEGIKVRDARSFGLAGWLRLRAHQPEAHRALIQAIDTWQRQHVSRKDAA